MFLDMVSSPPCTVPVPFVAFLGRDSCAHCVYNSFCHRCILASAVLSFGCRAPHVPTRVQSLLGAPAVLEYAWCWNPVMIPPSSNHCAVYVRCCTPPRHPPQPEDGTLLD